MFLDARSLPAGEKLEADICIVGAGPAGIALAKALSGAECRIVLAESGGFEFCPATQALNDGESIGLSYRINESRQRYFGGAGNTWAGNCQPLDPSNFKARGWLPHSGWPFARSALADAPGVVVLLNANLVQLVARDDGQSIASARFDTLTRGRFMVAARCYVLASGGIENARLLLAMVSEHHPDGLGNQYDLVGRFFTEHPEIPVGALVHNRPSPTGLRHV